jgi:predicted dehydrogenase
MSPKLKTGIVGLGILGRQYVETLLPHPDVQLVALCDVRPQVLGEFAARTGAATYTDLDEMLRGQSLDLVVVATPDHLHRAPVMAAIQAGVPNIIEEKPLATTLADARTIFDAVEQQKTRLFINYANRAMPLDLATYYVVQQQLIGRPVYAESRLDDNISVPRNLWGSRSKEFAGGSSTAHFLLSHVVDLMLWTFAPARITDVYAFSQEVVLGYTPDLYDAFLTFDSGLKVRVKAEWIKHMDQIVEFYTSITGVDGTVIYNKLPGFGVQKSWRANFSGSQVTAQSLQQHQEALGGRGVIVRSAQHYHTRTDEFDQSTVNFSLEHLGPDNSNGMMLIPRMLASIAEETLTPSNWQGWGTLPTHLDGLRQVEVVQAIIHSAQKGEPVSLVI